MSSKIGVQNIAHTNGTVAATVSSGGVVDFSARPTGTSILGTQVNMASTAVQTWTSIPSTVNRITVFASDMSQTNNNINGALTLRVGTGGSTQNTGYVCSSSYVTSASNSQAQEDTTGFFTYFWSTSNDRYGSFVLERMFENIWICKGEFAASSGSGVTVITFGRVGLSGALDTVSVSTYNGVLTHSSGQVNIKYES